MTGERTPDRRMPLDPRQDALRRGRAARRELAERFGTPLYVVSEDQLRRNARRVRRRVLRRAGRASSCCCRRSRRTRPSRCADPHRGGDRLRRVRAGRARGRAADRHRPGRISLNGPMKDEALLERAIRAGVRITLDSRDELERARTSPAASASARWCACASAPTSSAIDEPSEMSPAGLSIRGALDRYKAGIPTEDLLAITDDEIRDPALDLSRHPSPRRPPLARTRRSGEPRRSTRSGCCSTGCDRNGTAGPRASSTSAAAIPAPRDPFGRLLPQARGAPDQAPALDAYADGDLRVARRSPRRAARSHPASVRLELEPGRALYADAGVHLATVGNVKRQTEPTAADLGRDELLRRLPADVNLELVPLDLPCRRRRRAARDR